MSTAFALPKYGSPRSILGASVLTASEVLTLESFKFLFNVDSVATHLVLRTRTY